MLVQPEMLQTTLLPLAAACWVSQPLAKMCWKLSRMHTRYLAKHNGLQHLHLCACSCRPELVRQGSAAITTTVFLQAVDTIDWPEGFVRRDIGWRAIERM